MSEHGTKHMSVGMYVAIWAALLVLTGVTYGVAHVELGALNVPVAILIASVKGALVTWYFMHLFEQGAMPRMIVGVSGFFVALLILITASDLGSRSSTRDFPLHRSSAPILGAIETLRGDPAPAEGHAPRHAPSH